MLQAALAYALVAAAVVWVMRGLIRTLASKRAKLVERPCGPDCNCG